MSKMLPLLKLRREPAGAAASLDTGALNTNQIDNNDNPKRRNNKRPNKVKISEQLKKSNRNF